MLTMERQFYAALCSSAIAPSEPSAIRTSIYIYLLPYRHPSVPIPGYVFQFGTKPKASPRNPPIVVYVGYPSQSVTRTGDVHP